MGRAWTRLQRALQAVRRPRERSRVQRLLRLPGGRGPVEEEEEVEGQVQVQVEGPHHHQSRLSPISEKKNLSTVAVVCRERRKQIFGDQVDLSPPCNQSCHFINY